MELCEVTPDGCVCFEQKNKFLVGEKLEAMGFDGTNIECEVQAIYDEEENSMDSAPHPKQKLRVKLDKELETGIILRRKE